MVGQRATMRSLARMLSALLHRTVMDRTGLKDEYDFQMEWKPDERQLMGLEMMRVDRAQAEREGSAAQADVPGPSLSAALKEQMGLNLETTKGSVEILVIDQVEKASGN
jgi:uncharacterized protein (TIGR03435 family)